MLLGAIADDLTGATDLALILSREGMNVVQVNGLPKDTSQFGDADAVIIALKSRTIEPEAAVEQSLAAAKLLLEAGARQLFFKYCSTFDSTDKGNIGPVTDVLLKLVGESRTIACPAFPANGRTVFKGIYLSATNCYRKVRCAIIRLRRCAILISSVFCNDNLQMRLAWLPIRWWRQEQILLRIRWLDLMGSQLWMQLMMRIYAPSGVRCVI